jgi:aldose 1-epimerase
MKSCSSLHRPNRPLDDERRPRQSGAHLVADPVTDPATDPLILQNDAWQIGILPDTGASVAFGRIADTAGGWVDVLRPTDPSEYGIAEHAASYVLSPWSNRIRSGLLRFRGATYQLARSGNDGTAIHGAARGYPWRIVQSDEARVVLAFSSSEVFGVNFPWRFSTEVTYALDGGRFTTTTTVTNDDQEPFPVGFGHHPYFQRGLAGHDDEVRVRIPCTQQFQLEGCMASAAPVPVEEWLDFTSPRPLGDRFIDQNLTGRIGSDPIRIDYPQSGHALTLSFDDVYTNVVFYVPQQGKDFFAVEPVTNANDGFALFDQGIAGSGVIVLEAGESVSGSHHLDLE